MDTEPTKETQRSDRIILRSANDTLELKQLISEDALDYFALVDADRSHLSQHGDVTASKYPTPESVQASIINPVPGQYRFGVWDGKMVGLMKLKPLEEGIFETGSWISSYQKGNGYAMRARSLALDFAFSTLKTHKVISKIVIGNDASRKSIEKSGYRYVGETSDGEWLYELSKDEYEAMKAES